MSQQNKEIITDFIDRIWNQNQFELIDQFLESNFMDHALPSLFPPDKNGLQRWVIETGKSFEHKTLIEEMVSEDGNVVIKIKMTLKHIGPWRGIEATGAKISTIGYRFFKLLDGKIVEHWALLDGNAIENQLKNMAHGCKTQE